MKEFINYFIVHLGKEFYLDLEFNKTVKVRIGAKRIKIIKSIIEIENL